ncbi:MAG: SGNH/GDSL hydrolase family protein [Novosphingobium sp.]|nr:SGNH/GDSL hydrolase family protein [Novosphingobium sp.]
MGEVRRISSVLALLAVGACTTIQQGVPQRGSHYVAMGSSFAAGAGIGPTKPGTPERCGRTPNNYATLLAQRLGLDLDDQTCGGATTAHILGPWNELPAQIEAVTPETRLVTVTIGGNDLNYVGTLLAATCKPEAGLVIGGRKLACFKLAVPDADAYSRVEGGLRNVVQGVRERAPDATIVFVQYVTLVPEDSCDSAHFAPEKKALASTIGKRLAEITVKVANETGAKVLAADKLSRNHTTCDAEPWSIGLPPDYDGKGGAPWHPTAAGHAAIAEELATMLGR